MLSAAARRRPQVERAAGINHAAAHRFLRRPLHRAGLAGQRRLIQHRHPARDGAIDRYHVTGRDQQQVARCDRIERHLLQRPAAVPAGGPGRPLQQRAQIAARPPGRPRFQRPAAGQHHADHRGGQQLPHRQRADQRQQGDDIHPDPAVGERLCHRPHRITAPHTPTAAQAVPAAPPAPARYKAKPAARPDIVSASNTTAECRASQRATMGKPDSHVNDHCPPGGAYPESIARPSRAIRPADVLDLRRPAQVGDAGRWARLPGASSSAAPGEGCERSWQRTVPGNPKSRQRYEPGAITWGLMALAGARWAAHRGERAAGRGSSAAGHRRCQRPVAGARGPGRCRAGRCEPRRAHLAEQGGPVR